MQPDCHGLPGLRRGTMTRRGDKCELYLRETYINVVIAVRGQGPPCNDTRLARGRA